MASVNDYLKKLLYQYDCVVVPELGAFLTHYQSAAFTETSGLYLPPRKRVAFNEALRFDDGILANYIMLHEPVTRDGAQRHISQFVTNLRQQVVENARFELEGIGTFTQNDEGRLQFVPGLRHNFFGEAYGMTAIQAQLIQQQPQPEPVLDAVPVTTLGPVLANDSDAVLTPYRPVRPYWRVAAAALLIGSLGTLSYFSVLNPDQPYQSSLDPANLLRVTTSFISQLTANPVNALKPVSVSKAHPAAKAVVSTPAEPVAVDPTPAPVPLVKHEPAVKPMPAVTPAPVKVAPAAIPVTEKKAIEKTALPVVKHIRTSPHYTVIAGVFQSKRNALSLKRQLRKAGYSDAFVIMPTPGQKEQYKVAAVGSPVREEAVAKMPAISELTKAEPWIYKN